MAPQNEAPIQIPATIATIPISVELDSSCSSVERSVSCSVEGKSSPRSLRMLDWTSGLCSS